MADEPVPHLWLQKGWWYASLDKPGQSRRRGKVLHGFREFGALAAQLRGGDEELRKWSAENPPEWREGRCST